MNVKILLILIIIIFIVIITIRSQSSPNNSITNELNNPNKAQKREEWANEILLEETNERLKHILASCNLNVKYNLLDNPKFTYVQDKLDINICTSCINGDNIGDKSPITTISTNTRSGDVNSSNVSNMNNLHKNSNITTSDKLDKILYMGLHEIAHVINKGKDHDANWENIFKKLLIKAGDLGYLDKSKLKI